MQLRRYISLLVCGAGLVFFLALNARAESTPFGGQVALGVSPAITELILEPGQSQKLLIEVTNLTNQPLSIKAAAGMFQLTEEVAEKDRAIFDASLWIKFDQSDFILQAGQQKHVTVIVTPPPNAEPGGHYATILFQPLVPVAPDETIAAYVGTKVGVLNLIIVKGDLQETLTIKDISAPPLSQHGPIEFSLALQNAGNVHLMPTGIVEIYNVWGKQVETLTLPPTLVLPKTTKNITITWDNKRFGYYKAKATIFYGTNHQSLTSQRVHTVIMPWFNLILLIAAGGMIGFVGWRTRGRWRKALRVLFNKKKA